MNWFKHDADATTDAKVKKLLIRYGVTGYAIYFHCLELIAGDISETNITFQLEHDSEIIADNLRIKGTAEKSGIAIVEEVMRYIISLGLFEERGNRIFCYKLLKRIDLSMTGKSVMRKMITEARRNHDGVMIGHDGVMNREGECSEVKGSEGEAEKPAKPRIKPPTLEAVLLYFKEKYPEYDGEEFFNYWESMDWRRSNGPIRKWERAADNYVKRPWAKKAPEPIYHYRAKECPICHVVDMWDGVCRNRACAQYTDPEYQRGDT